MRSKLWLKRETDRLSEEEQRRLDEVEAEANEIARSIFHNIIIMAGYNEILATAEAIKQIAKAGIITSEAVIDVIKDLEDLYQRIEELEERIKECKEQNEERR